MHPFQTPLPPPPHPSPSHLMLLLATSSSFEYEHLRESDYTDDPMGLARHHAKIDIAKKEKEFEDVKKQQKKFFGPRWGLSNYNKSKHPLSVMVNLQNN